MEDLNQIVTELFDKIRKCFLDIYSNFTQERWTITDEVNVPLNNYANYRS